jgi:hypothetical protein
MAKDERPVALLAKAHLAVLGDAQDGVRLLDVDTFTTLKTRKLDSSVEWLRSTEDGRVFIVTYKVLYRIDEAGLAATRLADFAGLMPYRMAMNEDRLCVPRCCQPCACFRNSRWREEARARCPEGQGERARKAMAG